ncbi:hypothetical protein cyc_07240 [Cyclospora cayetanensis]|uniref:Uncharacterized protein n=1 Tax=Cyclospora cayetanensis TaxID=88456 RepID=A0A1D3D5C2_9EIME|nr:hypothetical protein cyc_07240 [Cyclospora cayetanensis]
MRSRKRTDHATQESDSKKKHWSSFEKRYGGREVEEGADRGFQSSPRAAAQEAAGARELDSVSHRGGGRITKKAGRSKDETR